MKRRLLRMLSALACAALPAPSAGTFAADDVNAIDAGTAAVHQPVRSAPPLLHLTGQLALTRFPAPLSGVSTAWLARRRILTVGLWGDDYAPIQFRPGNDTVEGIAADYLHLLGNALGTPIRARWFANRTDALAALHAHEIDLLNFIGPPAPEEQQRISSVPYLRMPLAIVRRAGPALTRDGAWHGRATLIDGQQDARAVLRQREPDAPPPRGEPSLYRALAAVSLGKADYYIGDLVSATYCIEQGIYLNLRVTRIDTAQTWFAVATAADRPELTNAIQAAFDALPPWLHTSVLRRWAAGAAQDMKDGKLPLSQAEHRWIAAHPVVRVGVDAANAPYTFIDSAGEFTGIYAELLKLIGRRTGLRFEAVARDTLPALEADLRAQRTELVTTLMPTPARRKFVAFSTAVAPMMWTVVARSNDRSVEGLASLRGKRLALVAGHGLTDVLRAAHPDVRLVFVRTAADALDLVARGGAEAALQTTGGASYSIERYFPDRLRIAGTAFDDPDQARFGVSTDAPELLSIIDKALAAISPAERAVIASRWLANINYPTATWQSLRRAVFRWMPWALGALTLALVWNCLLWYQIRLRKRVERELRAARDAAENASTEKSDFLAVMSHEIRTPMSAVIGLLELAQRRAAVGIADPEPLAIAQRSARELLELIGDLLDLRKAEAGELSIVPRAIDLRTLLTDTAALFAAAAEAKGIALHYEIAPEVPPSASFDPMRLRQVISNLLSNAVKFTTHGEVVLRATLAPERGRPTETPMLQIAVRDTGSGIPAAELATLFEPFRQASSPVTHAGTGLGLAIVKRLVALMGGNIDLTSEPGHGTRIVIKLPFAPCAPGAAPASARTPATPAALLCASAPLRVLAVDDHPLNRRILADQLTTLGYTPIEAADADAALAAIEAGVDLVLTDCNMPGTSGSELTRKIRAAEARGARPRLPVLGYTANALPHARIACLGAGMDDVLIKPLDLEQVGAALARWFPDRVAPRAASLLIAPSPVGACMPAEPHAPARPASPVPAGLGESLRDDLTALKRALDIQAWDTAADYAHRIQGVIGCTVRDEAIDQVCVVLEMLARRGAPDAAITLAAQYARLATLLQRYTAAV